MLSTPAAIKGARYMPNPPSPTPGPVHPADRGDLDYPQFLARIQARFDANLASSRLFTTDAPDLFAVYLDHLADRQYHNCHCCRRFLETYGSLATIDEAGRTTPAIWDEIDAPDYYKPAVAAMARLVRKAKVTGVFLSVQATYGTPVTGPWNHLSVKPPGAVVHSAKLLTAGQAMAEKREDFGNVARALGEFNRATVETACRLLDGEALYRSEKVAGPAKWLKAIHEAREATHGTARDNVLWRAIATAPAGFCHPRSSMVGTLLEDIAGGMDYATVSRRFAAKMHPLQYQRPTAAPSAGNIARGEEVVAKLGIARSLERRFARIDEVEKLWEPGAGKPAGDGQPAGVFGHLSPKQAAPSVSPIIVPPITMTWDKFARTILPTADAIEYFVRTAPDNFVGLLTAEHADAPPILQWDADDFRNPVSWYCYSQGSLPGQWGLTPNRFARVNALTPAPFMWGGRGDRYPHHAPGVLFILDGARDRTLTGNALFPEILKGELREIRSTIESYSRSARVAGVEGATANGVVLSRGGKWDVRVRVTGGGATQEYRLDRWD